MRAKVRRHHQFQIGPMPAKFGGLPTDSLIQFSLKQQVWLDDDSFQTAPPCQFQAVGQTWLRHGREAGYAPSDSGFFPPQSSEAGELRAGRGISAAAANQQQEGLLVRDG